MCFIVFEIWYFCAETKHINKYTEENKKRDGKKDVEWIEKIRDKVARAIAIANIIFYMDSRMNMAMYRATKQRKHKHHSSSNGKKYKKNQITTTMMEKEESKAKKRWLENTFVF